MSFTSIEEEIEKEAKKEVTVPPSVSEDPCTCSYYLHYLFLCWRPILVTFCKRCKS